MCRSDIHEPQRYHGWDKHYRVATRIWFNLKLWTLDYSSRFLLHFISGDGSFQEDVSPTHISRCGSVGRPCNIKHLQISQLPPTSCELIWTWRRQGWPFHACRGDMSCGLKCEPGVFKCTHMHTNRAYLTLSDSLWGFEARPASPPNTSGSGKPRRLLPSSFLGRLGPGKRARLCSSPYVGESCVFCLAFPLSLSTPWENVTAVMKVSLLIED